MNKILEILGELGVVPVVKIDNARQAPELGHALHAGGLPCAEITFRTTAALEAIELLSKEVPQVLVGAGTVLNIDQAKQAVNAGASFIVSPGFDLKVVNWCLKEGVPVTPGVMTPTEINMALDRGLSILKFFPAEVLGGPPALKAIAAAYVNVKFIPTGGVTAKNLAEYLRMPMVHCCGGSWIVKSELISTGDFQEISELTREARNIVKEVRKER